MGRVGSTSSKAGRNQRNIEKNMKILVTKAAGDLLDKDLETRSRQIGLVIVENESGTMQVNATEDEVDDFQRMTDKEIDSDIVPDALLSELVGFLQDEKLFEEGETPQKP
jgi:hypothetical protein